MSQLISSITKCKILQKAAISVVKHLTAEIYIIVLVDLVLFLICDFI